MITRGIKVEYKYLLHEGWQLCKLISHALSIIASLFQLCMTKPDCVLTDSKLSIESAAEEGRMAVLCGTSRTDCLPLNCKLYAWSVC